MSVLYASISGSIASSAVGKGFRVGEAGPVSGSFSFVADIVLLGWVSDEKSSVWSNSESSRSESSKKAIVRTAVGISKLFRDYCSPILVWGPALLHCVKGLVPRLPSSTPS